MANIQIGTAAGTTLGNPPSGDFYIFIDSDNVNAYTLRDSAGTDTILGSANPATLYGLYSQTVQSATITNTVTETSVIGSGVGSLTVPANFFYCWRFLSWKSRRGYFCTKRRRYNHKNKDRCNGFSKHRSNILKPSYCFRVGARA